MEDAITTQQENDNPHETYAAAGVDIAAGDALVQAIKPMVKGTARPGSNPALGGFGALFDLREAGYRDPILVSSTDGVGTKLRIAIDTQSYETIGIDLVAMCVNDLVVQGAEPLFFLDYFASGRLDVEKGTKIVSGITKACVESGCALIGGETAEMPGLYQGGDFDLAGFTVGAVERDALMPHGDVAVGDVVLGLASNGLHSNGFSLVRRLVEKQGLRYDAPAPFDPSVTLGAALLAPTRLYVKPLLPLIKQRRIKAMAHITGGGLLENIPRALPDGLGVWLSAENWTVPPVFKWLAQVGSVESLEMARAFNCGIGMVLILAPGEAEAVKKELEAAGETVFHIGEVEENQAQQRVTLQSLSQGWPC